MTVTHTYCKLLETKVQSQLVDRCCLSYSSATHGGKIALKNETHRQFEGIKKDHHKVNLINAAIIERLLIHLIIIFFPFVCLHSLIPLTKLM